MKNKDLLHQIKKMYDDMNEEEVLKQLIPLEFSGSNALSFDDLEIDFENEILRIEIEEPNDENQGFLKGLMTFLLTKKKTGDLNHQPFILRLNNLNGKWFEVALEALIAPFNTRTNIYELNLRDHM